jgi:hypothetical protein
MIARAQAGFVLLYAVLITALVGMAVFLLAHSVENMVFESNQMYARARSRNLIASGKAWIDANAAQGRPAAPRDLNVDALGVPGGRLTVAAIKSPDQGMTARIQAVCVQGRNSLRREVACPVGKSP